MLKFSEAQIDVGRNRPALLANFSIQAGQRVLVAGTNGSGKTSLLDAAVGLRPLVSGAVELGTNQPVAYVVQDTISGLLPWLSVEENILLPSRLYGLSGFDQRSIAEALLGELRIDHLSRSLPTRLSGGERQ